MALTKLDAIAIDGGLRVAFEGIVARETARAQAKKTQRRKFMDYLAKQPTSLGGTVGELPKPLQKQVASQYTRSQRKEMMDRMDREANDGKQK